MAATMDVRQEEGFMNFGGQNYFDSFPRLEKRGRIPRRERTNYYWRSDQQTAAAAADAPEKQQEEARDDVVAVWDKSRESAADEAIDQEERETTTPGEESERSSDDLGMEEREIQEQELDPYPENNDDDDEEEEEEGEITFDQFPTEDRETTRDEEKAKKSNDHDDGGVEEREIREKESDQPEKEKSLENPAGASEIPDEETERSKDDRGGAEERENQDQALDPEKNDEGLADEGEANPEIPAEERETSTDHRERVVSADGELFHHESGYYLFFGTFPALIRRPKVSSDIIEERGNNQENKLDEQKSDGGEIMTVTITGNQESVAVGEELQEEEGAAEESEAQERNETLEESSDERETSEGGERENIQDLETAAVIRPQETQVEEEEEGISFGGNNYEKHFPKIERRERITKRERRGEYA